MASKCIGTDVLCTDNSRTDKPSTCCTCTCTCIYVRTVHLCRKVPHTTHTHPSVRSPRLTYDTTRTTTVHTFTHRDPGRRVTPPAAVDIHRQSRCQRHQMLAPNFNLTTPPPLLSSDLLRVSTLPVRGTGLLKLRGTGELRRWPQTKTDNLGRTRLETSTYYLGR